MIPNPLEILGITPTYILTFTLVAARTSAIFATAPVFGSRVLPARYRLAFALFMAYFLLPFVAPPQSEYLFSWMWIAVAIFKELVAGFAIGFAASMVFTAIQVGGQIMGMQLGFSIVSVMDPQNSSKSLSLLGEFYFVVALLLFFVTNAHHVLLLTVQKSFEMIPLTAAAVNGGTINILMQMFYDMFAIGFQFALPLMGTLLLVDVGMGVLARTMPQMNVFLIGFNVKIMTGLLILLIATPFLTNIQVSYMYKVMEHTLSLVGAMISGR